MEQSLQYLNENNTKYNKDIFSRAEEENEVRWGVCLCVFAHSELLWVVLS